MVDSGYTTPTDRLVVEGTAPVKTKHNAGTIANVYPGRLAVRETTDYDIKVGDGILPPVGYVGYEDTASSYRPATLTTIYALDDEVPILRGGGFTIYMPDGLALGTIATKGDLLASWGAGKVVPAAMIGGKIGVKIPFTKNTSQKDTGVDIPSGAIIHDVIVQVTTADGSGTIDVGLGIGSEAGYDADGLLDGESLAATGFRTHNMVDATAGSITLGVLLDEVQIKDATGTAVYFGVKLEPGMICDGTCVSVDYTTSNHTVAGYIYVLVSSPGIQIVGRAGATADASAATCGIFVESEL